MLGIRTDTARIEVPHCPAGAECDSHAQARSGGRRGQRPPPRQGRPPRRARRRRDGGDGRDVDGQCGQVGVGPRGQRLAGPRVEFSLIQPSVYERVLQRLDYLLAVGVARPQPVTARRLPLLRSCHRQHLPQHDARSVARLRPGDHAQPLSVILSRKLCTRLACFSSFRKKVSKIIWPQLVLLAVIWSSRARGSGGRPDGLRAGRRGGRLGLGEGHSGVLTAG